LGLRAKTAGRGFGVVEKKIFICCDPSPDHETPILPPPVGQIQMLLNRVAGQTCREVSSEA